MIIKPIWLQLGGSAFALGGLWAAHLAYSNHHYKRGIAACEAKQAKADDSVTAVTETTAAELSAVDEEKAAERVEVHKTYTTGLTAQDMEYARQLGKADGIKEGRREAYEDVRKMGGCLAIDYDDNDSLRVNGRSVQTRLLEAGIGEYRREEAPAELSGAAESDGIPEGRFDPDQEPD